MHIADLSKGMLGANGIVGGGPPLICGRALASKLKGDGGVAVAFFGDGASQPGHHAGVAEPGLDLEPAGDLRRGEQRLRRGHVVDLVGGHRRHRRPGRGVRDARRDRRRVRLLRRARGGRRGRGPGPRGRRPDADRGQVHPLLRPLRGRPAALPGRRGRATPGRTSTASSVFRARVTESGQLTDDQLDQVDPEVADGDRRVGRRRPRPRPKPGADDLLTDVYVSY